MADDEAARGVRDEHPLRDVQAGVGGGVDGRHDAVAGHLDAAGLPDHEDDALVCAGVEAAIGGHLDVGEALKTKKQPGGAFCRRENKYNTGKFRDALSKY